MVWSPVVYSHCFWKVSQWFSWRSSQWLVKSPKSQWLSHLQLLPFSKVAILIAHFNAMETSSDCQIMGNSECSHWITLSLPTLNILALIPFIPAVLPFFNRFNAVSISLYPASKTWFWALQWAVDLLVSCKTSCLYSCWKKIISIFEIVHLKITHTPSHMYI